MLRRLIAAELTTAKITKYTEPLETWKSGLQSDGQMLFLLSMRATNVNRAEEPAGPPLNS